MMPKPVHRPDSVGAIQWILGSNPVHPNLCEVSTVASSVSCRANTYQKSPIAKETPPIMTGGRRHSGIGILLLAASLRLYAGWINTMYKPASISPVIIPKKGKPPTP